MAKRFQVLLTTMQLGPESVQLVVEACTYLHNLMCERYIALHNAALEQEAEDHGIIPREWWQQAIMHELEQVAAPNRDTRAG